MNQEKENRIMAIGSIVMLLILVATCTFGCKSKNKIVQKEQSETLTVIQSQTVSETNETTQTKTVINETMQVKDLSIIDKIELVQAEPHKTIVFTDATGKTTTIRGANAVIKSKKTKTQSQAGSEVTEENKALISESSEEITRREISQATETVKKDIYKTGTSPWISFFIGLFILIVLIVLYRRYSPI